MNRFLTALGLALLGIVRHGLFLLLLPFRRVVVRVLRFFCGGGIVSTLIFVGFKVYDSASVPLPWWGLASTLLVAVGSGALAVGYNRLVLALQPKGTDLILFD